VPGSGGYRFEFVGKDPLAFRVSARCGDGTLYTGITNDLGRRLAAHCAGRGARYTRGRRPLSCAPIDDAFL